MNLFLFFPNLVNTNERFWQPESKRTQYISYDVLTSILNKMKRVYRKYKNFKSGIP